MLEKQVVGIVFIFKLTAGKTMFISCVYFMSSLQNVHTLQQVWECQALPLTRSNYLLWHFCYWWSKTTSPLVISSVSGRRPPLSNINYHIANCFLLVNLATCIFMGYMFIICSINESALYNKLSSFIPIAIVLEQNR